MNTPTHSQIASAHYFAMLNIGLSAAEKREHRKECVACASEEFKAAEASLERMRKAFRSAAQIKRAETRVYNASEALAQAECVAETA